MADFCMKIAGQTAQVHALFESTPQFFWAYLTDAAADFSIAVTPENLVFEQAELDEEARVDGFRRRQFTDPFLERAAIQRAFAEHLFHQDTLLLHGSAVAVDGQGFLFLARSGTGKSTHTRFWREAFEQRAVMINDDKPFLKLHEDSVTVFGSPWSGKHGLDSNIAVPLKGICILERGEKNTICPITPAEAMPMLHKQVYHPLDPAKADGLIAMLDHLAAHIPLWHMACTKDLSAAHMAYKAMVYL